MSSDSQLTDWETVPCSRCGGTGHYSYCQMYGTTCFKCGGKKMVLTARAQAALAWLREQRQTPVSAISPGMRIKVDYFSPSGATRSKTKTILEIKQSGSGQLLPDGQIRYYTDIIVDDLALGVFPESVVEVIPDTEEGRIAQVRAAIAYQNTLTKAGKPRKAQKAAA